MRTAPNWLPLILLCIQRQRKAHLGFFWPQAQGSASTKWSGLVFTNEGEISPCRRPYSVKATLLQTARDWKHLLPRQCVPQPPTWQSPHCWQYQAGSLKGLTGKGKVGAFDVLHANRNSSGRGSQWEVKFSTLYLPGGRGSMGAFWVFLSERWHLRYCPQGEGSEVFHGGNLHLSWGAFLSHPEYSISFPLWILCLGQRSRIIEERLSLISIGERLRFPPPNVSPSLR